MQFRVWICAYQTCCFLRHFFALADISCMQISLVFTTRGGWKTSLLWNVEPYILPKFSLLTQAWPSLSTISSFQREVFAAVRALLPPGVPVSLEHATEDGLFKVRHGQCVSSTAYPLHWLVVQAGMLLGLR